MTQQTSRIDRIDRELDRQQPEPRAGWVKIDPATGEIVATANGLPARGKVKAYAIISPDDWDEEPDNEQDRAT